MTDRDREAICREVEKEIGSWKGTPREAGLRIADFAIALLDTEGREPVAWAPMAMEYHEEGPDTEAGFLWLEGRIEAFAEERTCAEEWPEYPAIPLFRAHPPLQSSDATKGENYAPFTEPRSRDGETSPVNVSDTGRVGGQDRSDGPIPRGPVDGIRRGGDQVSGRLQGREGGTRLRPTDSVDRDAPGASEGAGETPDEVGESRDQTVVQSSELPVCVCEPDDPSGPWDENCPRHGSGVAQSEPSEDEVRVYIGVRSAEMLFNGERKGAMVFTKPAPGYREATLCLRTGAGQ